MENNSNSSTWEIDELNLGLFIMAFRAYGDPVICLMALFGNIGVLTAMVRINEKGFNRSVRFYYSVLAIDELIAVGGCVFAIDFLEFGIAYLTGAGLQKYPIPTIDGALWSCKFLVTSWRASSVRTAFFSCASASSESSLSRGRCAPRRSSRSASVYS